MGAWSIARGEKDAANLKVSLSTRATDGSDARLSLSCRDDVESYQFSIRSVRPAEPGPDGAARFGIRVVGANAGQGTGQGSEQDTGQGPVWFQTALQSDGSILVQDRPHRAAFVIVRSMMTRRGATMVELTVGDQRAAFSLDGFDGLQDTLQQRCGYEFGLGATPPPPRPGRR
jgi:hypothetical protein